MLFRSYARYSSPQGVAATQAYVDLAKQHSLDPAQMALAFLNAQPFVASNIIGATTMAQLESNIQSVHITLSEDVLTGITSIHQQHPNPAP